MDKKREKSNSLEWHAHNFIAVWYSRTIHRSETRKKRIVSPYYKIPCRTDLKHLDPDHSLFPTRARSILELLITICCAQMHLSVFNQHSKIKKKITWNLEITTLEAAPLFCSCFFSNLIPAFNVLPTSNFTATKISKL
jgi:hypothetical protein